MGPWEDDVGGALGNVVYIQGGVEEEVGVLRSHRPVATHRSMDVLIIKYKKSEIKWKIALMSCR